MSESADERMAGAKGFARKLMAYFRGTGVWKGDEIAEAIALGVTAEFGPDDEFAAGRIRYVESLGPPRKVTDE